MSCETEVLTSLTHDGANGDDEGVIAAAPLRPLPLRFQSALVCCAVRHVLVYNMGHTGLNPKHLREPLQVIMGWTLGKAPFWPPHSVGSDPLSTAQLAPSHTVQGEAKVQ